MERIKRGEEQRREKGWREERMGGEEETRGKLAEYVERE